MYRQYDSRHDKFGLMPKVVDACFGGGGGGSGGGRRDSNITTTNGVTGGNASGNKNTQVAFSATLKETYNMGPVTVCTYTSPVGNFAVDIPRGQCPDTWAVPKGFGRV
jgi:uncharacterized spore protein YtfJ